MFSERGYAGASIELIARAAQLSVGAIYLYFRSKEDLYVSLIEDALTVFDVEMGQVREHTEVAKRLFETWQILVRWAERDAEGPRILRLLAQPAVRPQLSDEVVIAVSAGIARIQDHIGACVADGIHATSTARSTPARSPTSRGRCCSAASTPPRCHEPGMPADSLQIRTDRALALIESALAPQVAATLRASRSSSRLLRLRGWCTPVPAARSRPSPRDSSVPSAGPRSPIRSPRRR